MKNFSLNAKFVFVLSIFVFSSIAISTLSITKLNDLNNRLNKIVQEMVPRVLASKSLGKIVSEIKNQEKVFILEPSREGKEKIGKRLDDLESEAHKEIDYLRGHMATQEGLDNVKEVSGLFGNWKTVSEQIRKVSLAGKNELATSLARTTSRDLLIQFDTIMEKITDRNVGFMENEVKAAEEIYESSRVLLILVSSIAVLTGLTFAFFILRAMHKAIDHVINDLNDSSIQLTSAAQQIASSSEELSQGATEQASSLEETSSAVEEMNSMVQKNADNARQSSSISQTSGESAIRGKKVVEDMKRAMRDIDLSNSHIMQQTNESNQKIFEIVKVISEIGNKTKVINDIVFQTKLLSFNASVEAARAGEHGKGFAVVAEEVGNLAQMSGNAAKEISALLESSIHKVESIVHETKSSVEKLISESKSKVELGNKVASDCGDVLEEIVSNVTQVTQMSHSISSASDEQARGISEITKAVSQLDQMTQQNAAASEETASAAAELSAQAETMQMVVQTLIFTIKGGENTNHHHEVASPVAMRAPQAAVLHRDNGRVLHLGKTKRSRSIPQSAPISRLKMASGGDSIPAENDPRFKDL